LDYAAKQCTDAMYSALSIVYIFLCSMYVACIVYIY
jgi:hypothetical protein